MPHEISIAPDGRHSPVSFSEYWYAYTHLWHNSWSMRRFLVAAVVFAMVPLVHATTVPRLTFEQLTDASEVIAAGEVTQSWAAWDSEHKYIWTHYRLAVSETAKGPRSSSVEFAEPGGALGNSSMTIAGTVTYGVGERVAIFLSRMPNGYLRTAGWAQGKYTLDASGRLHGYAAMGEETVNADKPAAGVSLRSLDGMSFAELKQRIASHVAQAGVR
jgi:hypothetical protein